jgi:hypothetical protein
MIFTSKIGNVILSEAKNLSRLGPEILRFAQNDRGDFGCLFS